MSFQNKSLSALALTGLIMTTSLATSLATSPSAFAGGDGFASMFTSFFGTEKGKAAMQNCDQNGADASIISGVNSFFCHMEKDMGMTGVGSVTKSITSDGHTMSVHAEITGGAGGASIAANGTTYDYLANVWVCTSGCTNASNFNRVISLAFSYVADKTINKGFMVQDSGAFQGSAGTSAMTLSYDVGSSTTNKIIVAKFVNDFGGQVQKARFDGAKSGNTMTVTGLMVQGASATTANSMRFSAKIDTVADTASAYFEANGASGTGAATPQLGASSDSPTPMCLSRTRSATDFDYKSAGGSCTVAAFPSDTLTVVGGYTAAGLAVWNAAMQSHPSSI
jgi:hypothetical protein